MENFGHKVPKELQLKNVEADFNNNLELIIKDLSFTENLSNIFAVNRFDFNDYKEDILVFNVR